MLIYRDKSKKKNTERNFALIVKSLDLATTNFCYKIVTKTGEL